MKKFLKILWRAVELGFIVIFLSVVCLVLFDVSIPAGWVEQRLARLIPPNLDCRIEGLSLNLIRGVALRGVRVYDRSSAKSSELLAGLKSAQIDVLGRRVTLVGARYTRLPDSYYLPGNLERNARVEAVLPRIPSFVLILERPEILGIAPERVVADIEVTSSRFSAERIRLDWPDRGEPMALDGFCTVDLDRQAVEGEVRGAALQRHIRPLLEALDLPVSLPYMDAFTGVKGKIPSSCGWHVNLVNNDFTLDLGLKPTLGAYRSVPMKRADGTIHLLVQTRGTSLNYHHTFGPIIGVGPKDEPLEGTVWVDGTNGYNTVQVKAKSALPIAHLLKIGGFEDEYVDADVYGDSACDLEFRFPRAMTNNYEVLNGRGRLSVANGQLMRIKGFQGLIALLAERVPGVAWFTDSTQGSCDYTITDGVIRSDNIYIEGTVFSLKMYGSFDAARDLLDFTVRVQFTKKDSIVGKILHPLTWPFTKLLLEFRLTGSTREPKWEYISVVDRVLEVAK